MSPEKDLTMISPVAEHPLAAEEALALVTAPGEESPVMVLRLGGTVDEIKPAQLAAEIEKTRASLR